MAFIAKLLARVWEASFQVQATSPGVCVQPHPEQLAPALCGSSSTARCQLKRTAVAGFAVVAAKAASSKGLNVAPAVAKVCGVCLLLLLTDEKQLLAEQYG